MAKTYDVTNKKQTLMKTTLITMCLMIVFAFKQSDDHKIASATVKTLSGSDFKTESISNNGKPIILSFWATWCKNSVSQYDNIAENYSDWQKETGVKLVSISTDDTRTSSKVVTTVKTKGWEYEFYLDINQEFKRAMNVNNCPHTFLVDGAGNIVWQQNGYSEGTEDELYAMIKKLAKGEKLDKK